MRTSVRAAQAASPFRTPRHLRLVPDFSARRGSANEPITPGTVSDAFNGARAADLRKESPEGLESLALPQMEAGQERGV